MDDGGEAAARVVAVRDECVREVAEYLVESFGGTLFRQQRHAIAIFDMIVLRASTLHK